MSKVSKVSIALTAELNELVQNAVASGSYASASEVVREALRAWEDKQIDRHLVIAKYRTLIQEGIDSGMSDATSMDEIIAEARRSFVSKQKVA